MFDKSVGAVVIGRNEGERLVKCLDSLLKCNISVVYVDSGSTDQSVANAVARGVHVVTLDMSLPFTAARARNSGFNALVVHNPSVEFVQFVDGDCEIIDGWVSYAVDYLLKNPTYALVCGRRRERYPEASIYNYQCDVEWNTPLGDAKACGGDFLCRTSVYKELNGFNPNLIAGEEPEFCVRIRRAGWLIRRLDKEMTWHDAAIMHFVQWWKRNVRSGHAFAEGSQIHGAAPEYHWVRETRRAVFWGGVIPFLALISVFLHPLLIIFWCLLYAIQIYRVSGMYQHMQKPFLLALLLQFSKFAEFVGVFVFWKNRLIQKQARLIEYK